MVAWFDGYHLGVVRYYQGIASERPYGYWVWADLALAVACAGPVAAVILRRAVVRADPAALLRRPLTVFGLEPVVLLPVSGLLAILAADLSGLGKAEVERIWLPFAVRPAPRCFRHRHGAVGSSRGRRSRC